jgi:hypothetical protein
MASRQVSRYFKITTRDIVAVRGDMWLVQEE